MNNSEIESYATIHELSNKLLKRGSALKQKQKQEVSKEKQKQIQHYLEQIVEIVNQIREAEDPEDSKNGYVPNKLKSFKIEEQLDPFINQLAIFLTKLTGQSYSKMSVIRVAVLYFYENVMIKYQLREEQDLTLKEFLDSQQTILQVDDQVNGDKIYKLLKYIDQEQLKLYYLVLNLAYQSIPVDKQLSIEDMQPYNKSKSPLSILDKGVKSQIKEHFKTIYKNKNFKTL